MAGICPGLMLLIAWWRTFILCQTIVGLSGDSLNKGSMYDIVGEEAGGSVMLA